jgi:vancomycin resistance protein YoaR
VFGLLLVVVVGIGLLFSGSPGRLARGTRIADVDVGGLTPAAAEQLLSRRAARLQGVPVTFVVGSKHVLITPRALGVSVDWRSAVAAAERRGGGFAPLRGYRRLALRLFPGNRTPTPRVYDAALDYELSLVTKRVGTPHREARLVRQDLDISVVHGTVGHALAQTAAAHVIVHALQGFSRRPVALPVEDDPPSVTVADLQAAAQTARRIVSAPVVVTAGTIRSVLTRQKLAAMLTLPQDGKTTVDLTNHAADLEFAHLQRLIDRGPRNATWAVTAKGGIRVVPAVAGVTVDVPSSVVRVEAAASSVTHRVAALSVVSRQPKRSTAQAEAMGITGTVGTYETIYGGIANRVHNVQLVAHLVDRKLIAPGATFSFNQATGARTAAQGFLEAPVIINGEVQTGLGGGVCQVSTTVFNAAYEAGLPITARTNHALYISHYPLGRDATVDYPSIDMKFVNNTPHWLLLRTFVGSDSLVVTLYGAPQHRRVVSEAAPLVTLAKQPVKRTLDRSLKPGQVVIEDPGQPAQSTSVRRVVYDESGKLISDATWYSSYRAVPELIHFGPKKVVPELNPPSVVTRTPQ